MFEIQPKLINIVPFAKEETGRCVVCSVVIPSQLHINTFNIHTYTKYHSQNLRLLLFYIS